MTNWNWVREQFVSTQHREINFAGMLITPHPAPVRAAITKYREQLDLHPWTYFWDNVVQKEDDVAAAASGYFGVPPGNIALTDGTTQGLTLLYAGINVSPEQEILTSDHEFSAIYEILAWRAKREKTRWRKAHLFENSNAFRPDTIIRNLKAEVSDRTRVIALTWVYSSSGVKLPITDIAAWIASQNAGRYDQDRILLCVDGVHAFGIDATTFRDLGCDFFVAGCHKSIFGPRGTGVWCGTDVAWSQYTRLQPTSTGARFGPGRQNSPGGVHDYDHRWPLKEAFAFLVEIGPMAIQERIASLATMVKDLLARIPGVTVFTPAASRCSCGIVCFDVAKKDPSVFVDALRKRPDRPIVASVSSEDPAAPGVGHVRVSCQVYNNEADVQALAAAVADLA